MGLAIAFYVGILIGVEWTVFFCFTDPPLPLLNEKPERQTRVFFGAATPSFSERGAV